MGHENASLVYESFLPVAHSYADAVEEGDASELCNIEFSLAYGGKILLHNTRLRLLSGHRWVRLFCLVVSCRVLWFFSVLSVCLVYLCNSYWWDEFSYSSAEAEVTAVRDKVKSVEAVVFYT